MDKLSERIRRITNCKKIADAFDFDGTCEKCGTFNPTIDPMNGYLCACIGTCPAVTLSKEMLDYIHRELGWKPKNTAPDVTLRIWS